MHSRKTNRVFTFYPELSFPHKDKVIVLHPEGPEQETKIPYANALCLGRPRKSQPGVAEYVPSANKLGYQGTVKTLINF